MTRWARHRWLGLSVVSATLGSASCSLLYGVQGFDANYDDAGEAGVHDAARDTPDDRALDGPHESAAPTMPLFHYRRLTTGSGDAAVSRLQPGVAFLLDSGSARAIGCPHDGTTEFEPSLTTGPKTLDNGPYRYGQLAMRSFRAADAGLERPPGTSKLALAEVLPQEAGGYDYSLLIADELADCDASHPTVRVDPTTDPVNAGKAHVLPRFSPDGSRVAYLDLAVDPSGATPPSVARVETTGVSGMSPRALRTASPFDPKTNLILWAMPPAWIDGKVVWLEGPDPSCSASHSGCASPQFHFNFAVDSVTPTYGTFFKCPYGGAAGFTQIAELAYIGGMTDFIAMVASRGTLSASPPAGVMDIYLAVYDVFFYDADHCSAFVNVTRLGTPGAVARDMTASPDGRLIAYTANAGPGGAEAGPPVDVASPTHIWLLAPTMKGSAVPTPCSDPSADPAFDDFGPQWFDDGKILVWTRAAHPPSAAPDTVGGLFQADVVGGACMNVRPVLSNGPTEAGALTVVAPANATIACGVAPGRPRSDAPFGALAAALLAAFGARRRRRRR